MSNDLDLSHPPPDWTQPIRDAIEHRLKPIWDFANRRTHNLPIFAWRTFRQFNEYRRHEAASFAYWALFALFPVIILITLASSSITTRFQLRGQLVLGLSDFIPLGEMKVIRDSIVDVLARRQVFGTFGVVGLIIGALGLFGELRGSLGHIFGKADRRPWYTHLLLYFGMVIALALLVLLSAGVSLWLRTPIIYWPGTRTVLNGALTTFAIFLVHTLLFALLYRFMPRRRVQWASIVPIALLAAFSWDISRALFDWYLTNFQNLSGIYGSIGLVIGLLVWFFLTGNLILLGGEIIVTLERWHAARQPAPLPELIPDDPDTLILSRREQP